MKKDRNCAGTPYPIYPPYQGMGMMPNQMMGMPQGMMPNQMMAMPIPNQMMGTSSMNSSFPMNNSVSSNTLEQQLNALQEEINSIEKRVTNLENLYNQMNSSASKYNSSNYQMM